RGLRRSRLPERRLARVHAYRGRGASRVQPLRARAVVRGNPGAGEPARDGERLVRPRPHRAHHPSGHLHLGPRGRARPRDPSLRASGPPARDRDVLPVPLRVRGLDRHEPRVAPEARRRIARGTVRRRDRRRARWTPDEVGLAIFGGIAIVISFLTLVFSLVVWRTRIVVAARELLALGPVGVLILGLIALVFVGPLAIALAARAVGATRTAVRLSAARRARVAERELAERIGLLARVRFLAGMSRAGLAALASHLVIERFGPEDVVFAAGSVGDRFYLVRSGRLRAIAPDGADFGTIVPGEGFGELALLDRAERS